MMRVNAVDVVTALHGLTAQIEIAARSEGLAVMTFDIAAGVAALKVHVESPDSGPMNCMLAVKEAVVLGRRLACRVEDARARRN